MIYCKDEIRFLKSYHFRLKGDLEARSQTQLFLIKET